MLLKTFRGGVHPPGSKNLTQNLTTTVFPAPKKVVIPLSQHTGAPCQPQVAVGDEVEKGALLGKSDKYISSPVHASISGKVTKICDYAHPVLGFSQAVEIEKSDRQDKVFSPKPDEEIKRLSKEALLEKIKDAGIVGMGGAAFPAHVKLSPPPSKRIDTFILNGAECEPFITCDHRLMIERPMEILKGAEIAAKVLGVKNVFIAIEDNKKDAIAVLRKAMINYKPSTDLLIEIAQLPAKYPQGAEKQVIRAVLGRIVPHLGLPMDVGCVVHNVGTVFAMYEAVFMEKPLIERYLTITGDCVKQAMNLMVPVGTLASDIVDFAGGLVKDAERFIMGGPMMGITQYTLSLPVIKGTNALVFLSKDKISKEEEKSCVRCGHCVQVCPMDLAPVNLMNLVKKSMFEEASLNGVSACIECGACAYECPSKIPLVDYLKYGKVKERELSKK